MINNDPILFDGAFLQIRKNGGFEYLFEKRTDSNTVVVFPFKRGQYKSVYYLGRYEICPAHHEEANTLCSLTGGVDIGEAPLEAAIRELDEEAGIKVSPGTLWSLGIVRPSKMSNTTIHLYTGEILDPQYTEKDKLQGVGDGSSLEAIAYCKWVAEADIVRCKDPLAIAALARLKLYDLF